MNRMRHQNAGRRIFLFVLPLLCEALIVTVLNVKYFDVDIPNNNSGKHLILTNKNSDIVNR